MTIATWRLQIKQEWARTYSNGGWVTSLDSRDNMGSAGQTSRLPHFWSPASLILVRRLFRALNFRALREQREKPVPPSSTWHLKKQDTHTHTHGGNGGNHVTDKNKTKGGKISREIVFLWNNTWQILDSRLFPLPLLPLLLLLLLCFCFFFSSSSSSSSFSSSPDQNSTHQSKHCLNKIRFNNERPGPISSPSSDQSSSSSGSQMHHRHHLLAGV